MDINVHDAKDRHNKNKQTGKVKKQHDIKRKTCQKNQIRLHNDWLSEPSFGSIGKKRKINCPMIPSETEFNLLIPRDTRPFPIADIENDCPGLLGKLAVYLDRASTMESEAGGISVALPVLGAIMGRAYATQTGLCTNIYSIAIGESGTGKTSLVNPAKELMQFAKIGHLIGQDRIASGAGLIKMLLSGPKRICFLDEFGHMLQQIGMAGTGVHAKQILSEFTQLFSAARSMYMGTAYATREPERIDSPHLCIFGMATPDQFWRACGSAAMVDGSIARYIIFPIGNARPKDPDPSLQNRVVDAIKFLTGTMQNRIDENLGNQKLCIASMTKTVEKLRRSLIRTMDGCARYAEQNDIKGGPAILRRVAENAIKIALISAVGRDPVSPRIEERDFNVGHAIARWSASAMINRVASHIADNQFERNVNDVELFILQANEKGRVWRELQRRFRRIRKLDLQEIVEGLEQEKSIRSQVVPNPRGGHSIKTFLYNVHHARNNHHDKMDWI